MATLPIPAGEPQPEKEKSYSEDRLQLVPEPSPRTCVSVSVHLGNHVAEIRAFRHTHPRKTTYSYIVLTMAGERIYQSGNGYLSVSSVVEKAAQHLDALWNVERY